MFVRKFSSSSRSQFNVAVLGAAGGIGQPLSLLLKMNPLVTSLRLFDIVNTPGVAADLSHINTVSKVTGYKGDGQLADALKGVDLIIVPAVIYLRRSNIGSTHLKSSNKVPRKPGMTRDDLFNINAGIVKNLAKTAAQVAPKAHVLIISNPVNSTVPIVAEVYKKLGVYSPTRLFGVTTLDIVRASTFVSELKGVAPSKKIEVLGGHSGVTILPILSRSGITFTQAEIEALTKRIQFGGDEVVKAKDGTGSATLSMAQAGARFADSLLKALKGESGVIEAAYVESPVAQKDGVSFFSTNIELGPQGVTKIHPIGTLSPYEKKLYDAAIPELKSNIQKGVEYVAKNF